MESRLTEIRNIWEDNRWLYIIIGIIIGVFLVPIIQAISQDFLGFVEELKSEAVGVFLLGGVVEVFMQSQEKRREFESLKNALKSRAPGTATDAIRILWLEQSTDSADRLRKALEELELGVPGANWQNTSLKQANLKDMNLYGVNLSHAYLPEANLQNANLWETIFDDANLWRANLKNCSLVAASCQNSIFVNADLQGAKLRQTNFQNSNLRGTNLQAVNLGRANLSGADLFNANLQDADLSTTHFDENTILPDGSKWTAKTDLNRFTNPTHPDFWQPQPNTQGKYPWWKTT